MFSKKPMPEPTPPPLPSILRISGSMDPRPRVLPTAPPPTRDTAPPEPLERMELHMPMHRLAQMIIAQALREGASQLTLTPTGTVNAVHFLMADAWQDTMSIPAEVSPGLVSAFKTLAGLPVWEHRMRLEGLISVQCAKGDYDISITIQPTRHGEKITMRIEAADTPV